jgi:transposase
VDEKVALKGTMHSDLQSISPELLALTKNIDQVWFLNVLTSVKQLPKLAGKQQRRLSKISGVGKKYVERIKDWQKHVSFSDDASWVGEIIIEDTQRMIDIRAKIKALDHLMEVLSEQSEIASTLRTISGYGKTSCAEIAGEIGEISRFETEAGLAMYLEMAPLDNSSGAYQ